MACITEQEQDIQKGGDGLKNKEPKDKTQWSKCRYFNNE